ncbi:DUF2971 domain-containing protein [Biomaibacter acetigenes]|nr:DUF2971 domain-containing protein [Biomaibacter acetigenes]
MNQKNNDRLEASIKAFEDQLNKKVMSLHSEVPDTLYHYTTPEGLLGILSSDSIRFSNVKFLNDESELVHARQIISYIINKKKNDYKDELFVDILNRVFNFYDGIFDPYIACFSENGDLLSQWRGYAAGGMGYSIGFKGKEIGSYFDVLLRKVEYDLDKQINIITETLDGMYSLFINIKDSDETVEKNDLIEQFVISLAYQFADYMLWFKHPTFSEEKEWRAIRFHHSYLWDSVDYSSLEFKIITGRVVPYMTLKASGSNGNIIKKLPITKIIHGPTLNPDLTKQSLDLIIKKFGFNDVIIDGSTVPLRL